MSANPSLSLNLVEDIRQLTTFPFMVNALEAGTIVAVLAAVTGWYVVLRRQAFAGHTLSVMAFPGATGAALLGVPTSLGYYLACGAAALLMRGTGRARGASRSAETAAVGTIQAAGLAAGYLFLSLNQQLLDGHRDAPVRDVPRHQPQPGARAARGRGRRAARGRGLSPARCCWRRSTARSRAPADYRSRPSTSVSC